MMDSVIKSAPNAPKSKQHWLVWILLALVLCAAAVIIYFAQSGQFFKGSATLPVAQGPIFYVVDVRTQTECASATSVIGSAECPFEGLQTAYNHVDTNQQINPVELRLASGYYSMGNRLEFENRRVNINGSYDRNFTQQDYSQISVLQGAIKITNGSGKISGISAFNGARTDGPYIEIDNTGADYKSFTIRNVYLRNTTFPTLIKYTADKTNNQALIENLHITDSNATNGAVVEINGPADVVFKNNFLSGNTADGHSIVYVEDQVKIANNAIVNTPGGNETGGIYTKGAIEINGGMDAKLINNTFADNSFSSSVVKMVESDEYLLIINNLILGNKNIFNVPYLSDELARGNYWDVGVGGFGETHPIYGINETFNGRCDAKLAENRNKLIPESYKLGTYSDCKDKGVNTILDLVSPDYFGVVRPVGDKLDPGFSESLPIYTPGFIGVIPVFIGVCGNGTLETNEGCDDGNTTNGDGCSSTCTIEEFVGVDLCSNIQGIQLELPAGLIQVGNECLTPDPIEECGNGILETGEECDDGNTTDGDGCDASCLDEAIVGSICGDGVKMPNEPCDDGNTTDGDGCEADCTLTECPDGQVPGPILCWDGLDENGNMIGGCAPEPACIPVTVECGNGILEAGEQCDDGNDANGDGCDNSCLYEDPSPDLDLCPNLSGDQSTIPAGYYYDPTDDECKELVVDYCLNINGDQEVVPSGYERRGLNCYVAEEEGAECGEWIDVSSNDPEFDLWVWLCDRGILKGHSDGSLRPDDALTRSELLALAFRASDHENEYDVDEDANYCFVDVDNEWFAQYACTAEDLGFVEGYAGNIFDPARKVILAEGLKMYLGALDEPFTINSNPDRWYYDMLFDAEDDDFLPYTLTDPQVVGPIELSRRKAANMLYRIMIYR